jgi:hypothetical protein
LGTRRLTTTDEILVPRNLRRLHTRLIDAAGFDRQHGVLSVRFDDGDLAAATLEALQLPDKPITGISVDEFRRGIEIHFRDGSVHDVAADYLTWLTEPEYAAAYPRRGPRKLVVHRRRRPRSR